jgi:hypothetical protein
MKAIYLIAILSFLLSAHAGSAQSADRSALAVADSMLHAYSNNNLNVYANLSYPGIVSYYGGNRNYMMYLERARALESFTPGSTDKLEVIQLETRGNESQCVIQRSHETTLDNKKAVIISYMVGQSLDKGKSWTFFDVALNSVDNITWIMPDIFQELAIPLRQVVYQKTNLAGN